MVVKTKPYEHQLTAYNKAYGKEFFALFMEMGTGKTKVSIDLAGNYFNDMKIDAVLVVAPNSVHRQWAEEEIIKHCAVDYTTFVWSAMKSKTQKFQKEKDKFMKSEKLKFFCVNVETFSHKNYIQMVKDYLKNNRCLFIVDESTTIKNPDAKRTKSILRLSKYSVNRLVLTGTPVTNSPFDLWSQFEFLKEGFWNCVYFIFRHRYGLLIKEKRENNLGKEYNCTRPMRMWEIAKYKGLIKKLTSDHIEKKDGEDVLVKAVSLEYAEEKVYLTSGISEKTVHYIATHENIEHPYKGLEKLKNKITPYTYTVKKEDCKDIHIPDKIPMPIYVDMTPEQKKIYIKTKKYMMSNYANRDLTVMNKLSLLMRLQQITGGFFPYDPENGEKQEPLLIGKKTAKFSRLEQDLQEVRGDEKIIIWCKFTAEIRYLYTQLHKMYPDDRVETYYGGTKKADKADIIRDFKKGEIKILIANSKGAQFGLNLQKSSLHYFYSNDFSLERRLQSEDRSHRIGQKNHLVIKDIIIRGSIDDMISKSLIQKKNLLDFFRDKSLKELLDEGGMVF